MSPASIAGLCCTVKTEPDHCSSILRTPPDIPADSAASKRVVWHLRIAYDGTNYHGWQIQPTAPTIQGLLQQRLRALFRLPELTVQGTSRTDAGVHALDQHASFLVPEQPGPDAAGIMRALNGALPADIRVLDVRQEAADFNARFAAAAKSYIYCIHQGSVCSPFESRYLWHVGRTLNIAVMQSAAEVLAGTHDFASFAVNPKREIETTVKTVHRLEIIPCRDRVYIHVLGNSFLYKMVRSLVGYLCHLGKQADLVEADQVRTVLAACDRSAAADTAPAGGLFLARVFFADPEWEAYKPVLPPFLTNSLQ